MTHYASLTDIPFETLHKAFIEAFADYVVQIPMTFKLFQRMMIRNGVDRSVSIGTFDEDRIVGFILNGLGDWNGIPTVYDSGTALIPEFRGKGHAKGMFNALLPVLKKQGVQQYLLEVIQSNEPAVELYRKLGFTAVRELRCFKAAIGSFPLGSTGNGGPDGIAIEPLQDPDWSVLSSSEYWDHNPSWQNSVASVGRVGRGWFVMGALKDDECVGYCVIDPLAGYIVQLAVKRGERGKGIGSSLLDQAVQHIRGKGITEEIRVINVDSRDAGSIAFLERTGFTELVDQYEMILPL